jgi:hypothetical protein
MNKPEIRSLEVHMQVKQISVFLENKKGRLAEVTAVLGNNNISIKALSLADTSEFGMLRMIVTDPDRCTAVLKKNGFVVQETPVAAIEVEDKPGGLRKILELLDSNSLNVEYMYATVERKQNKAVVIFKVDDREKTEKVLKEAGIALAGQEVFSVQ